MRTKGNWEPASLAHWPSFGSVLALRGRPVILTGPLGGPRLPSRLLSASRELSELPSRCLRRKGKHFSLASRTPPTHGLRRRGTKLPVTSEVRGEAGRANIIPEKCLKQPRKPAAPGSGYAALKSNSAALAILFKTEV